MSNAPETKYTDRDVREDAELVEAAYEYLESYAGEFEFLIDCKMRIAQGAALSVGMVRGILNCMRVDPRVQGMPEPRQPDRETVVEMRPRRIDRQRARQTFVYCENTDIHPAHGGPASADGFRHCVGVYDINRGDYSYRRPAFLHDDIWFMAGRTGVSMLHKTRVPHWLHKDDIPLPPQAAVEWFPNTHAWGWRWSPKLRVFPFCSVPQSLVNPILLTEAQMLEMQSDEELCRPRCPRCMY